MNAWLFLLQTEAWNTGFGSYRFTVRTDCNRRVNKNSTSYNHSHHLRFSRLRDSQHSEDIGWDHLRYDPSIYFVSLLDNSANQSDSTIVVHVACRAPYDTITTLNSFFVHVDILCQESFVKLCKVSHSWQVIFYNITQESSWQPLSSTHFGFSSGLLLSVRYWQEAGQAEHKVRSFCHIVLWCLAVWKNDSSLEGHATYPQSLPHSFTSILISTMLLHLKECLIIH